MRHAITAAAMAIALLSPQAAGAADAPRSPLPFSSYVEANGTIYVSGHLPLKPGSFTLVEDDITRQTHAVISNVRETLAGAGAALNDVVRVTVYLTTMADFAAFNAAYAEHFRTPYPARTTVAVHELAFGARIEMSTIAVRDRAGPPTPR